MKLKLISENIISITIFALILVMNPSCKSFNKLSKGVKKTLNRQENHDEKVQKEYELAIKEHHKKQSYNTKELMKRTKKQQKKNNIIRKRSLWDKIFRRKCNIPR